MVDQIIKKIQLGLKTCSEKHIISAKDVQMIIDSNGKVNLMNANHIVVNGIDVCKVFNVSMLENMMVPIVPYLKNKVIALAKSSNLDVSKASARIFTKQADFYPSVILQEGDKIIKEITVGELLK
jgi:hypothetical protein